MKIKIDDKTGTIELGNDVPLRPTDVQAGRIMREISAIRGEGIGAVKLSGYWTIGRFNYEAHDAGKGGDWRPIYGHRPGQQRKSFDRALSDALGVDVVRTVRMG